MSADEAKRVGHELTLPECRGVADLINACLMLGVPEDYKLRLLSPHDLDAEPGLPAHAPGCRLFELVLPPSKSHPGQFVAIRLWCEDGLHTDSIRIPHGSLLASTDFTEKALFGAYEIAEDLKQGSPTLKDRREFAKTLDRLVRDVNVRADFFRAEAADPDAWPMIGPRARFAGVYIAGTLRQSGALA